MTPSSRTPADGAGRRARGQALRQARGARVAGIRRRVVASALALFVATWLLIAMLLVTGHDPALASQADGDRRAAAPTEPGRASPATTSAIDHAELDHPHLEHLHHHEHPGRDQLRARAAQPPARRSLTSSQS